MSSADKAFENSGHIDVGNSAVRYQLCRLWHYLLSQSRLSVLKLIIFAKLFIIIDFFVLFLSRIPNIMTVLYDGKNSAETQHAFISIAMCSFYSLHFLFIKPLFEHDHPCSEMWPCQQKTFRTIFWARPYLVEWWCNFIHR